jgi:hypothetical protein
MNAPPGWKLVPIAPTMAMVVAGGHALLAASFGDLDSAESEIHAAWRAMLAAAPHDDARVSPDAQ